MTLSPDSPEYGWLALSLVGGLGFKTIRKLQERFGLSRVGLADFAGNSGAKLSDGVPSLGREPRNPVALPGITRFSDASCSNLYPS